ncbi:MAG: GH92 family glycosyl hydrolase [Clostridiales bacterium]|nr:GH92 family glycosyl hydrolase [Clostridiales bacterium]
MKYFRVIISLFLSLEMLFSCLTGGYKIKREMPEKHTGPYTRYVNEFIGTGGIPWTCAMLSPAACSPFGCVRVGPDTCATGGIAKIKTNTSGYYYEHGHLLGFSHGRLSGTGARDYGMFRVTPCVKGKKANCLPFSHENESAYPGYYGVYLPTAGALCEMTASSHCAAFRFTFSKAGDAAVCIDASSCLSGGSVENEAAEFDPEENSLTARATLYGTFSGRYGGLTVYLYAAFDSAPVKAKQIGGETLLSFAEKVLEFKTAVSFVSAENAKENLTAEAGNKGFDEIRDGTVEEWENRLSAVRIDADEKTKEIFYTALYHSMIMPTNFTDADGSYVGFDKKVHTANGYTYRTDMSLWDTCRVTHSLYALTAPDIQRDCIESLLTMADHGGVLPRWPMGAGYSGSMFGNPANIVLTESYLKGFDFDAEKALYYMVRCGNGEIGDSGLKNELRTLNEYGYLPDDMITRYSVSKTLEFSWENAAVSRLAAALGKEDIAEDFANRSMYYKNVWDSDSKYFMPRNADGTFHSVTTRMTSFFDDIFGTDHFRAFCEGGADHWRWSVQQDTPGLISLFGSEEEFVKELEKFMESASRKMAAADPGTGYWIGNQHDIHTPYLFIDAGRSDLTQKWVRWTLENRFSADINGLDGNDDGGTLSSWYVFSSLGFYPIAGTDEYYIGSPVVDGASLELENGSQLKITVRNNSAKNIYVRSVTLNGASLTGNTVSHEALISGGELVFEMSPRQTNKKLTAPRILKQNPGTVFYFVCYSYFDPNRDFYISAYPPLLLRPSCSRTSSSFSRIRTLSSPPFTWS